MILIHMLQVLKDTILADIYDKRPFPLITRKEYIEGAKSINKDISIFQKNVNGFADATLGNTIAKSMINNGADIIFAAAGNSGIGAINCCTENGKK